MFINKSIISYFFIKIKSFDKKRQIPKDLPFILFILVFLMLFKAVFLAANKSFNIFPVHKD